MGGVNPIHMSHMWKNTWTVLWDSVKIYLTATCHNKSAPCYGPGDFGSMGSPQLDPWVPHFHLPPKKTEQLDCPPCRAMLLILLVHWWMSCNITSSGTFANASIIKNLLLFLGGRTGWLPVRCGEPALVGWQLTGRLPYYQCDSLLEEDIALHFNHLGHDRSLNSYIPLCAQMGTSPARTVWEVSPEHMGKNSIFMCTFPVPCQRLVTIKKITVKNLWRVAICKTHSTETTMKRPFYKKRDQNNKDRKVRSTFEWILESVSGQQY